MNYKVKFGDIWKLGNHRLLCGDSTEPAMMERFLIGQNPALCVTDPPYGVNYKARVSKPALYDLKVKNDHVVSWGDAFRLSKAPVLYAWFGFKGFDIVSRAINDAGYDVRQMLIWVKNHFSLQRFFYHLQHEQCLLAVRHDVKQATTWTGDRKQRSVWFVNGVRPGQRIHPAEKPTGVYTIPIINHTREGDIVVDLFAGSGVLFEACEALQRVGLGIELCPDVCFRIIGRMERLGLEVSKEINILDELETVLACS